MKHLRTTPADKAIAKRLRAWRYGAGFKSEAVARQIGVTGASYTNYELGRTPLKWGAYRELWRRYALSPLWLATGKGAQTFPVPLMSLLPAADAEDNFSVVFERELAAIFARIGPQSREEAVADLQALVTATQAGKVADETVALFAEAARKSIGRLRVVRIGGPRP